MKLSFLSSGSKQEGFHQTGSQTRVGRASGGMLRGLQQPQPTDLVYFFLGLSWFQSFPLEKTSCLIKWRTPAVLHSGDSR